jgi:hypothetical protein
MFKSSKHFDANKLNLEDLEGKKLDRQKQLTKLESEKDECENALNRQAKSLEQKRLSYPLTISIDICSRCYVYHEQGKLLFHLLPLPVESNK